MFINQIPDELLDAAVSVWIGEDGEETAALGSAAIARGVVTLRQLTPGVYIERPGLIEARRGGEFFLVEIDEKGALTVVYRYGEQKRPSVLLALADALF